MTKKEYELFDIICESEEPGECTMTENEKELLRLIRDNKNPTSALMTATFIVLGYLKQHGSSEEQASVGLREHS